MDVNGQFAEYIKQGEPGKKEKAHAWQTAIGLQDVDGLKPSPYLVETALENIEGKIAIDEVKHRIDSYYKAKPKESEAERTEEADKVSARIAEMFGFDVANDIFAQNSWYFRNALVRANYNDFKNGIHATNDYLEKFFRNLLLGEKNALKNIELKITSKNE